MSVSLETLVLAKKYTDKIASQGISETLDYNKIKNIPIINKNGTDLNPIDLSLLEFGEYKITGNYIYNSNMEESLFSENLIVSVIKDTETQKKVIKFEEFINSELYIVTLIYEEDGSYIEDRFSLKNSSGEFDIAKEVKLLSF